MRISRLWFLLLLAAGTPAVPADLPSALAFQELEGRVSDAEKRATFESGERERLAAVAEELRARVSALSEEAGLLRRRVEELDRLKGACEEREEALRAELDVCGRTRARAEEQKVRCASELDGIEATHRSELLERERVLEECRGRSADLEAQNLLLAADKKAIERERQESFDELTHNYDDLVASIRKNLLAYQERERADSELKARRAEEASLVLEQLRGALPTDGEKGRVALFDAGSRVGVRLSLDALYAPKTTELKPSARKILKALADVLRAAADRAVIVQEEVPARPKGGKERGATVSRSGTFSNAVRVTAFFLTEGGLDQRKIAIAELPPSKEAPADLGLGVVVTVVSLADFDKFFSGAAPTPAK